MRNSSKFSTAFQSFTSSVAAMKENGQIVLTEAVCFVVQDRNAEPLRRVLQESKGVSLAQMKTWVGLYCPAAVVTEKDGAVKVKVSSKQLAEMPNEEEIESEMENAMRWYDVEKPRSTKAPFELRKELEKFAKKLVREAEKEECTMSAGEAADAMVYAREIMKMAKDAGTPRLIQAA